MAKSKKSKSKRAASGVGPHGGAAVTAEAELESAEARRTEAVGGVSIDPAIGDEPHDDVVPGRGDGGDGSPPATPPRAGGAGGPRAPAPPRPGSGGGFFDIYKRGQGFYTRWGTAIGAGTLILAGANFMHEQLTGNLPNENWALYVRVGLPLGSMLVLGFLTYWLVGVNRKSCDFMIATEGEMKKVNWTSRKAIVGSTKVVIVMVALMASLLFLVDAIFMLLFNTIGVLEVGAPNVLEKLWQMISGLWQ